MRGLQIPATLTLFVVPGWNAPHVNSVRKFDGAG